MFVNLCFIIIFIYLILLFFISIFLSFFSLTFFTACEKCKNEKRKTINGDDLIYAMTTLGFENYTDILKMYLQKYREVKPKKYNI